MNRPWRWWRDWLLVGAIVLTVAVAVGGCAYLRWSAYRQRFPQSAWWTFFIPMGK